METNVVTPSGNSSIPTMVVTTGKFPPPNPSSLVWATMVSIATTLHSGLILSLATATTPFTPSATGPPFSYGMPSSGTSPVLSYSTSQTSGLGAGSSMLLCKDTWGALLILLTLSLTEEVIYLLCPLHSMARINNPSGHLHIIVYLERGVKDHLHIICRSARHRFLCSVHLVTMLSRQLLSQLGSTPILDNLFLCRVLFLHRGTPRNFFHTRALAFWAGIRSLVQECQSRVILFTINGTPDKALCLSPWDRHGAILPKVLPM
jgi:hypothetical protein